MAPRTKEQQIAYNEKRRKETAAKKAAKPMTEKQAVAIVAEAREQAVVKTLSVPVVKREAKPEPIETKRDAKVRAKIEDKSVPPKRDAKAIKQAEREGNAAAKKVLASVPVRKTKGVTKSPTPVAQKKAAPVAAKVPVTTAPSRNPDATMKLSYIRNGAPGGGMQRGKNFQATVTFTPEQFEELRDKALFNHRSLAEQIRWSVMQTLKG